MKATYTVKGNKTAKDVEANNEVILGTGLTRERAQAMAIAYQRAGLKSERFVAAWIEAE